jgi:hypothetical protein
VRSAATVAFAGMVAVWFLVQPDDRWMYAWGFTVVDIAGAIFCIAVIALSTRPVLNAFLISLVVFVVLYIPLSRRKYALPDPAVRTGEFAKLRERHDDPGTH